MVLRVVVGLYFLTKEISIYKFFQQNYPLLVFDHMDADFSFLSQIPGQVGYIVMSDSCIIQSSGDLENEEFVAVNTQKMLLLAKRLTHIAGKIEKMSIAYPEHNIEVVCSGKYVFIVKRKITI